MSTASTPTSPASHGSWEIEPRLRILAGVLLGAMGLTVAANHWPFFAEPNYTGFERPLPRSRLLAVSFLGYTNGNAIIQVKNESSQPVLIDDWVHIHTYAPERIPDFRWETDYGIRGPKPLPARAAFTETFPTPTTYMKWRAAVGGIGQREVTVKQALASKWPFRRWPRALELQTRYAQTDWITP